MVSAVPMAGAVGAVKVEVPAKAAIAAASPGNIGAGGARACFRWRGVAEWVLTGVLGAFIVSLAFFASWFAPWFSLLVSLIVFPLRVFSMGFWPSRFPTLGGSLLAVPGG